MRLFKTTILLLVITSTTVLAQNKSDSKEMSAEKKKPVQVLDNFRLAIINNDQAKASELLTDDARILESGNIESKEEYLSHHFHADGKFLSAMKRNLISQKVTLTENTAWVSNTRRMSGTYNERDLRLNSAELAVLVKTENGWKISALHWSSGSTE